MNTMNESILATIKKMLGLDINYDAFDTDIIVFINTAMMTLQQIGVGPTSGFTVNGVAQTWADFLPSDTMLEGVKSYLFLCVKMVFDPPSTSFVMEAMKQQKEELEWRLREQAEFFPGDGSRKGYWESRDPITGDETEPENAYQMNTDIPVSDGAFRAHGGWYASDPDFPWKDGPAQPAIVEPEVPEGGT